MKKNWKSNSLFFMLVLVLTLACSFCVYAAGITIYNIKATNITETSARVSAKIQNPSRRFMTTAGMYFGPEGDMRKIEEAVNNRTITDMWYDTGKWYGTLQPGTTYYYQFFVVADGVEYQGETRSFTTESPQPVLSFYNVSVSNVTQTSARISAKIKNPYGKMVTTAGVYLGEKGNDTAGAAGAYLAGIGNIKRIEEGVNNNTVTDIWYDTNKWYGTLQPGIQYQFQFFAIVDGTEYRSEIGYFATPAEQENNQKQFPEAFYLHQTGPNCTLYAVINLVRSKAFLENRNYMLINGSIESYAWENGVGLAGRPLTISLTDDAGRRDYIVNEVNEEDYWSPTNTNYVKIRNLSLEQRKEMLKSLLAEHPEGIVIWDSVGHPNIKGECKTHAALLTNYDANTGIFYVADSGSADSFTVPDSPEGSIAYTKKRELKGVAFFGGEGQDEKIKSITRILYIK